MVHSVSDSVAVVVYYEVRPAQLEKKTDQEDGVSNVVRSSSLKSFQSVFPRSLTMNEVFSICCAYSCLVVLMTS